MDTSIPEDAAVNVWHFQSPTPVIQDHLDAIVAAVDAFYSLGATHLAGGLLATDGHEVKIYDLADPEPRAPLYTAEFDVSPDAGAALPPEVACCLSLYAEPASGVPKGRRRGRLYIGPLAASTVDDQGVFTDTFIEDLCNLTASVELALSASGVTWEIYSPTDDIMRQVVLVAADNEPDIQRRRGREATDRTTRTVTQTP